MLPQALLIEGPPGAGRQQLALWLGKLLFCERERTTARGEPCGVCRGCRLVGDLSHPDLHWIVPVLRPKASEPDKQVSEVAEAIGEVMEERRRAPLYGPPDGMAIHGVATVRLIQRRAALKSVEGGPRLFVIGDAERLVPQESSQEAANALLKLLEEPPPNCWFVLTASDAGRLLPTIQSRLVPLRLGRLKDSEVRAFLEQHLGLKGAALDGQVEEAEGLIGRAVGRAGSDKAHAAATEALRAVEAGALAVSERVLKQNPWAARGEFSAMLDALEVQLGREMRGSGAAPRLGRLLDAMDEVARAREAAQGNVNPQLLLAVLLDQLSAARDEPSGATGARS